jgi:IS605 OrfB family transposase
MQRTISLKISAPDKFLDFLETCNGIFNDYVEWCFQEKSYSKDRAHKELYHSFVENNPEVPTGLIQSIRDAALESVKSQKFKFKPKKKAHSHVRYDRRTVTLIKDVLSFACAGKRFKQKIILPKFFTERYGEWKFQAATIGYDKHDKCFKANLIFKKNKPKQNEEETKREKKIVGIDRGLYNIVTLSDGFRYASNQIRKIKREMLFLKKQLQAKGTKSSKRKLKRLSRYERRFSLNTNHIISKLIVNSPFDVFVLEDLTGIRKQSSKGKKLNKWLSNWTFYQLEQLIKYKAEGLDKEVVKVDAQYTSQTCSNCGLIEKSNRNSSHYFCNSCGYREHSDLNAAINIRESHLNSYLNSKNCNRISAASSKEKKAEQAVCQSAQCLDLFSFESLSGTSLQPCAEGS